MSANSPQAPPSPRPRRLRRLLTWGSCGLAFAAIAVWIFCDLPRRTVEERLAAELGAEVHLGDLRLLAKDRFELRDLRIEGPGSLPQLRRLDIPVLRVTSTVEQVLEGHFRHLDVREAVAHLAAAEPAETQESADPAALRIDVFEAAVEVRIEGTEPGSLGIEARDIDTSPGARPPRGTVTYDSTTLDLDAVAALVDLRVPPTRLDGPELRIDATERGGSPRVWLRGRSLETEVSGLPATVATPRLEATLGEVVELSVDTGRVAWSPPPEHRLAALKSSLPLLRGRASLGLGDAGLLGGHGSIEAGSPGAELWEALDLWITAEPGVAPDRNRAGPWRLTAKLRGARPAVAVAADPSPVGGRLDADVAIEIGGGDAGTEKGGGVRAGMRARLSKARLDLRALGWAGAGPLSGVDVDLRAALDPSSPGAIPIRLRLRAPLPDAVPTTGTVAVEGDTLLSLGLHGPSLSRVDALTAWTADAGRAGEGGPADVRARLEARLDLPTARTSASAPDPLEEGNGRLVGNFSVDVHDLGSLATVFPWAPEASHNLEGGARGDGRLSGSPADPRLRGRLQLPSFRAATPSLALSNAAAELPFDVSPRGSRVSFGPALLRGELKLPGLDARGIEVRGGGGLLPSGPQVDDVTLDAGDLGRVEGKARQQGASGWLAELELSSAHVEAWREWLGLELPDLTLAGKLGADLEVALPPLGPWTAKGPLSLDGGGFASSDGTRVMEGLGIRLNLDASAPSGLPGQVRADLEGDGGGFLLLWNTLFADVSTARPSLRFSLRSELGDDGVPSRWDADADLSLEDGPKIRASARSQAAGEGGPGGPPLSYALAVDLDDLDGFHRRWLGPLLEGAGIGEHLEALAGSARLETTGSLSTIDPASTWTAEGTLTLAELRVRSAGTRVEGLGLDLPFALDGSLLARGPSPSTDDPGPGAETPERRRGWLEYALLDIQGLKLPPIKTAVWSSGDSLGLEGGMVLEMAGGWVTLERLAARNLLSADRHAETGLRFDGLRLESLAASLDTLPLEGSLDGHLPRVRLSPSILEVDGGGSIRLFGGEVILRDISGRDILSPFPRLVLSADFSGIDLGQVTRRFDVGEMTGILEGSLDDCVLFRGVPVSFRSRLTTVERKGVTQTVDVKAVKNITILGTGQGAASFFDRGLQRFLQRYRYARLGVDVELADDVLLLRGLERRGDTELFLRGRFPFGIDVVNARPGQTVSFQTMVKRLESLDFGGITTSSDPP